MRYLIDGHNLIGRMPDIDLQDPEDEVELVLRLRRWAARSRKRRVTVVFDHGLPGGKDRRLSSGKVEVLFASSGRSADAILISRIKNVKNPREFTLVSSDNHILRTAADRRMPVIRAEEFVLKLAPSLKKDAAEEEETAEFEAGANPEVSDAEVEMWLDLFDARED